MKVLLFAFEEHKPENPYSPHNYEKNFLICAGRRANNTVSGRFEGEASPDQKERFFHSDEMERELQQAPALLRPEKVRGYEIDLKFLVAAIERLFD
jgi:4-alpha-glucanotransferase